MKQTLNVNQHCYAAQPIDAYQQFSTHYFYRKYTNLIYFQPGALTLRNVNLRYLQDQPPVLCNLSCHFQPGEKVRRRKLLLRAVQAEII